MNQTKLKIFAMLYVLREIQEKEIELHYLKLKSQIEMLERREPIILKPELQIHKPLAMYDKNGKLFDPPKSKYHK
jgi:hypothetical protein